MAGFLEPDDGLVWTNKDGSPEASTLTDSEKIDRLETEVIRLRSAVGSLEPLLDRVNQLERQAKERERAERSASARYGRR